MRHELDAAAYRDAIEAADWFERQDRGRGEDFLDEVDAAIDRIVAAPEGGSRLETSDDPAVRRMPMKRFPYVVIYEQRPDGICILAVAHTRRRPDYWSSRRNQ